MATSKKRRRDPERTMALKEHLRELRNRLIKAAIGILLGAIAGFFLYDWLFRLLAEPIVGYEVEGRLAEIAFNTVGGPLDLMIRLSLFVGVVISSPIWLYQIWAFIMPGLKKTEKRYAIGFIAASVPLFLGGIVGAYSVLPQAIDFFFALNPEGTSNLINPDVYFTFVLHLFLAFGLAMVIPVVLVGINMMGLVTGKQVLKAWRGVVMLIAVVSALAAPGGDAVSMFFIAMPLTALFGIAILLCLLNDRRRSKREAASEAEIDELLLE
ncbi:MULTISPECIES: twin-arginine translocase subunit TatC [unclassified Nesterenkonia]|uniref:twin-arginine translocase subunit TatC n=1 Tax=unclassified Nesterenkonia TaxID=2629769 RepID=UPI002102EA96|nr:MULTISPECIES: twin-arginine translocase subunit TatC [unclassified Nesterenkonia]